VSPSEPIKLAPGKHSLAVSAHGHASYARAIEIESGKTETVAAELSRTGQSLAGFAALGLGAALAGSALVPGGFGLSIESEAKAIESAQETRALTVAEAERYSVLEADRDLYARTAVALAIGGAITATAGALLLALDQAPPITAGGESAE
jgi:hypothetical protein